MKIPGSIIRRPFSFDFSFKIKLFSALSPFSRSDRQHLVFIRALGRDRVFDVLTGKTRSEQKDSFWTKKERETKNLRVHFFLCPAIPVSRLDGSCQFACAFLCLIVNLSIHSPVG